MPSQTTLQIGDLGLAFWITIVVAVIAIIIPTIAAAYFYRKSRRVKRLCYAVTTANLIQDYSSKLSGLKIEYKGKNPSSLSVSKIVIWNDGNETINRADIAEADPLRIMIERGVELLDASFVGIIEPGNQFVLDPGLLVSFNYLDKDDGATIQLVHTGTPESTIIFYGRIKGSGIPVRLQFGPNTTLENVGGRLLNIALLSGLPIVVAFAFSVPTVELIGSAIFILLLGSSVLLNFLARRFPVVPKKFATAQTVL